MRLLTADEADALKAEHPEFFQWADDLGFHNRLSSWWWFHQDKGMPLGPFDDVVAWCRENYHAVRGPDWLTFPNQLRVAIDQLKLRSKGRRASALSGAEQAVRAAREAQAVAKANAALARALALAEWREDVRRRAAAKQAYLADRREMKLRRLEVFLTIDRAMAEKLLDAGCPTFNESAAEKFMNTGTKYWDKPKAPILDELSIWPGKGE